VGMLEKFLDRFREKGPSRPRSKMEAEKRRRLGIVLVIVVAVVAAVSIVGYGYYSTSIRPWNQRILKVNGTMFHMRYFVRMMRLYGVTTSEYADFLISTMKENALGEQHLESEFPDVDLGSVTNDEAVKAKIRTLLGLTDNATQEEFDEAYGNWIDNLKQKGSSEKDLIELGIKPMLVQEELTRLVGERDYPSTDNFEHAQVQALLVTGADDAAQLRARWEAGDAFDTLASEKVVSSSLRDLAVDNTTIEWVAKGIKSEAFDNYTFSAPFDVLSDPVQDSDDTGKYWVIRVVGREFRALSESDRDTLESEAYSKWLEEISDPENNDIVDYLNDAKLNWALDHVTVGTS
jgi:hypothetical protein